MSKPLTKEFLISKGSCCGSKCKNCPYYVKWDKGSTKIFEAPCEIMCLTSCDIDDMQHGLCLCYLDTLLKSK